jgi:hypothetical protein
MGHDHKKQVSVDRLLGVHDVHDITCPRINVLQFSSRNSTRIYEEDLEQEPEELKINLTELFKAMYDLDQWSNDIIKIVNKLPEHLYNGVLGEVFNYEEDYDKLINSINTDYKSELREYATEINGLIEQWQDYRHDLLEAKDEEVKQQKLLTNQEKELLFLTVKGQNTDECLGLIEFYKSEVQEQQEKKVDALHNFDRYIKDDFKKLTREFSSFLETVRERNDDVRVRIGDIKYQIYKQAKSELGLYQPDEYLDRTLGIKDKEANLGVLFNDTVVEERNIFVNFNEFVISAHSKEFITFDQMNVILNLKETFKVSFEDERKELLLGMLKENGFKTVRYYNDHLEYSKNRDNYTTVDLNKPLSKKKIGNICI